MIQDNKKFEKMAQEAGDAGKAQMDAFMKAGNIWMKGCEDMMKTCTELAQASQEKNAQSVNTLLSCKTLNEITETQNDLARQNYEDFMQGSAKLSELGVKITTEAFEPVNAQFSTYIKKATDAMAA